MTKEQAKECIMDMIDGMPSDKCADWIEALNMALDAIDMSDTISKLIKSQSCDDCISRVEALNVIEKEKQGWEGAERYAIDECHTRIAELPSVTPQPTFYPPCEDCNKKMDEIRKAYDRCRWIPVSERLPEDYGEYICTMSDGNVQECGFVPSDVLVLIPGWSTCEADGFKKLDYRDIKAWMPLPKPIKERDKK